MVAACCVASSPLADPAAHRAIGYADLPHLPNDALQRHNKLAQLLDDSAAMFAKRSDETPYDVIVVGAGPAGLSGALLLGRCRRRVLLLDDGQPRNAASRAAHGFFTQDGTPPETLRRLGLEQLAAYDVTVKHAQVTQLKQIESGFEVTAAEGIWRSNKLLVATGMREHDACIPGVAEYLGAGVFCCPYCDGWEVRDRVLGGLAPGGDCAEYGLALLTWSRQVTLFTHGPAELNQSQRARLERYGVAVNELQIEQVLGHDGRLRGVRLMDGSLVELDALFIHAGQYQHSRLAQQIGCEVAAPDVIRTHGPQRTNVPGLYVAGDAAAHVESISVAAADGYKAAMAIHSELRREQFP